MKRLITVAAMLVFFAVAASAQNGSQTFKYSLCQDYYNPCCSQMMALCYDVHGVVQKGGDMKLQAKGTAVGEDGTEYVISASFVDKENMDGQGADGWRYVSTMKFNALHGSGCDFVVKTVVKVTFNANGEPTAVVEKIIFDCPHGEIS